MLWNSGNICTIDIDKVDKQRDLRNNGMAEQTKIPTACLKEQLKCEKKKVPEIKIQPKDERKKISEVKAQTKDEKKKTPEIKIQTVKSSKEPADIERTKNRISRNVAINRSFNSNSKLELLRYESKYVHF